MLKVWVRSSKGEGTEFLSVRVERQDNRAFLVTVTQRLIRQVRSPKGEGTDLMGVRFQKQNSGVSLVMVSVEWLLKKSLTV